MRDAIGGAVNIVIIVAFIVIVLAYLAFNVNYTKASRMKNKIIATYEDYNGVCNNKCKAVIKEYAKEIGYSVGNGFKCPPLTSEEEVSWKKDTYGNYCYRAISVHKHNDGDEVISDLGTRYYYDIATRINIEIPIIQNIFDFQLFWVSGNTKIFYN